MQFSFQGFSKSALFEQKYFLKYKEIEVLK